MPLYDFQCKKCEHEFEKFCSIAGRSRVKCVKCKSPTQQILKASSKLSFFEEDVFWADPNTPVYVSDKRQLKDFCHRYGKYAPGYSGLEP